MLEEYRKKRDFSKTPEPSGKKKGKGGIYVVQKHDATRLHYDLRLEMDGVLKSWAIPKGPDDKEKRLAVETEDHPIEYADFEGTISEGYGAGTVEIWDRGTFILIERSENKIIADISGKRLNGFYCLIHMKDKNWLFFKKK